MEFNWPGLTWDHLIPQVYLKGWRDPQVRTPAQVWLINKDDLTGTLQPCKQILRELGFYLTVDNQGNPSNETERFLGLAESRVGFIRKQLELARALSDPDRAKLWEFVAGMFARTRLWREQIERLGDAAFDLYVRRAASDPVAFIREFVPNARVQALPKHMLRRAASRLLETARPDIERSSKVLARSLHTTAIRSVTDKAATSGLPFCIVHSDSGSFLPSDAPSFVEEPTVLDVPREEGPGALWFMPLSPKIVFVGGTRVHDSHIPASQEWTARFNHRLRRSAHVWLISSKCDLRQEDFAPIESDPPSTRELIELAALNAIRKRFE